MKLKLKKKSNMKHGKVKKMNKIINKNKLTKIKKISKNKSEDIILLDIVN
jgi:hypothetical protein